MILLRTPINRALLIDGASQTTNIANISLAKLNPLVLSIPPLAEQHRIVAKVDELMALCDELEREQTENSEAHQTLVETLLATLTQAEGSEAFAEAWQRIADHFDTLFTTEKSIDQLKQTILQLAVMGKLVPQNPNDEPASELLKKIAAEKSRLIKEGKIKKHKPLPPISEEEKPYELPKGWVWVKFGSAFDVTSSKRIHVSDYVDDGIPFFRSKEIGELNKGLPISTEIYISTEKLEGLRELPGFPHIGDLMLTSVGSIGNSWICDGRDFYYKDGNLTKVGGKVCEHALRSMFHQFPDVWSPNTRYHFWHRL